MSNITEIQSDVLASVTGGNSARAAREMREAGREAVFCGTIDKRADKLRDFGSKWADARRALADVCWNNLRDNVSSSSNRR